MQLSHFSSSILDIIVIYRSQQGQQTELNNNLKQLENTEKPQLIIGDFNFCYLNKSGNPTRSYLENMNFSQLVTRPTHIEGNLLDQAYLRDSNGMLEITAETQSKYYSDHKGIAIIATKAKR